MTFSTLRCACGSSEIVAIAPGSEPEYAPGGIVIGHGSPTTARCLACWPAARGVQQGTKALAE